MEKLLFCVFEIFNTDDNVVKTIPIHTDPQKRLNPCIMHTRPVVGDVTL